MTFGVRSLCKLTCGLFAVSLSLASTVFAQEPEGEKPQPPKIIRKSGGVLQAVAQKRVEPIYPPLAKAAQVSGSVVVEVTVDEEGNVISARAVSGHPLLKDAAIAAAQAWTFAPTELQGVRVKVIGTITFDFVLGDPAELEALEALVRANPSSPEARLKLADAYVDRGRRDEAVAAYAEAIRINPNYATAYYQLARTYETLSRDEEALEAYKKAVSVKAELDSEGNPKFTAADQAYIFIASIYSRKRQYRDAEGVLEQTLSLYPDLAAAHFYLGQTYLQLGKRQSALNEYNILKEKDPDLAKDLLRQIRRE